MFINKIFVSTFVLLAIIIILSISVFIIKRLYKLHIKSKLQKESNKKFKKIWELFESTMQFLASIDVLNYYFKISKLSQDTLTKKINTYIRLYTNKSDFEKRKMYCDILCHLPDLHEIDFNSLQAPQNFFYYIIGKLLKEEFYFLNIKCVDLEELTEEKFEEIREISIIFQLFGYGLCKKTINFGIYEESKHNDMIEIVEESHESINKSNVAYQNLKMAAVMVYLFFCLIYILIFSKIKKICGRET